MSKPKPGSRRAAKAPPAPSFILFADGREYRLTAFATRPHRQPPPLATSIMGEDGEAVAWIEPVLSPDATDPDFDSIFLVACARLARSSSLAFCDPQLSTTGMMVKNMLATAVDHTIGEMGPPSRRKVAARRPFLSEEYLDDFHRLCALVRDRCLAAGEMTEGEADRLIAISRVALDQEIKALGKRGGGA